MPPFGAITFVEEAPIIGVTVIGSACSPPGTVLIHAEPLEWKYPRTGVKMKASNLWGEHVNGLPWGRGVTEDWREAGLSSAEFHYTGLSQSDGDGLEPVGDRPTRPQTTSTSATSRISSAVVFAVVMLWKIPPPTANWPVTAAAIP